MIFKMLEARSFNVVLILIVYHLAPFHLYFSTRLTCSDLVACFMLLFTALLTWNANYEMMTETQCFVCI